MLSAIKGYDTNQLGGFNSLNIHSHSRQVCWLKKVVVEKNGPLYRAKEIRALGGLALHGDSCSRGIRAPGGIRVPHKIVFCFAFAIFFPKNVETGNPEEWCAKQFSLGFWRFSFHDTYTVLQVFFWKKTKKYLWCPKISFMIHTPFSRIHDTYSVLQDSWYILRSPGFCFMIRIWSKKGWNRVSYGEWAAKP